jgi:hypothetical protein
MWAAVMDIGEWLPGQAKSVTVVRGWRKKHVVPNNAITTPELTSLSWKGYNLFKITKLTICVGALLLWLTHYNMYSVFADQDELPVCGERYRLFCCRRLRIYD